MTLTYVERDLMSPEGAFYSAENADSPLPDNPEVEVEGAFYVWTLDELRSVLGPEDADLWAQCYGVKPGGNVEQDPPGSMYGTNQGKSGRICQW